MKITKWDEMSVGDYEELLEICNEPEAEDVEIGIVGLLCGVEEKDILALPINEYKELRKQAQFVAHTPDVRPTCPKAITLGETKYRISRDTSKLSVGQYIDFQQYSKIEFNKAMVDIISCFLVPEGCDYGEGYDTETVKADIRDYMSLPMAFNISAFFFDRLLLLTKATLLFSERTLKKTMRKEKDPKTKEEMKAAIADMKALRIRINGVG